MKKSRVAGKVKKIMAVDVLALILVSVALGAFGQMFMKLGLKEKPIDLTQLASLKLFDTLFQRYVFIGVVLYLIAVMLWFVVLSKAELSFAYPLISIAYIITAFMAYFVFGERISVFRWLGILLILGGVFLITRG
ncbi:MAG TPA: EamA family transporter [archaeon]|nr:EamA family transporter [archaeon]